MGAGSAQGGPGPDELRVQVAAVVAAPEPAASPEPAETVPGLLEEGERPRGPAEVAGTGEHAPEERPVEAEREPEGALGRKGAGVRVADVARDGFGGREVGRFMEPFERAVEDVAAELPALEDHPEFFPDPGPPAAGTRAVPARLRDVLEIAADSPAVALEQVLLERVEALALVHRGVGLAVCRSQPIRGPPWEGLHALHDGDARGTAGNPIAGRVSLGGGVDRGSLRTRCCETWGRAAGAPRAMWRAPGCRPGPTRNPGEPHARSPGRSGRRSRSGRPPTRPRRCAPGAGSPPESDRWRGRSARLVKPLVAHPLSEGSLCFHWLKVGSPVCGVNTEK